MGFLSRLFGRQDSAPQEVTKDIEAIEYKGFSIYPAGIAESGQYRVAGEIKKVIDGEEKTHRFIRSDVLPSESDANDMMVKKSQMFIDQMGDKMFS